MLDTNLVDAFSYISDNEDKERKDYELFSLKFTDSLYKKDIGKFLDTLSSHFI